MTPEDRLRAASFLILSRLQSGTEDVVRLDDALAAVAAERERCAKLCEARARHWSREGEPLAAVESQMCADDIREGPKK